jgi:biotin carboxyl carrier protein
MKYQVTIGEKKYTVGVDGDNSGLAGSLDVTLNGRRLKVDLRGLKGDKLQSLLADNQNFEFEFEPVNGGYNLWHRRGQTFVEVTDEKTERLRRLMGAAAVGKRQAVLKAAMPGLVVEVEVEPGQEVKKGDGLLIVEAMKMENEIKAPGPGVIKEIKVKPGQPVEKNQVLVVFD